MEVQAPKGPTITFEPPNPHSSKHAATNIKSKPSLNITQFKTQIPRTMKLLESKIVLNQPGNSRIIPEEPDDLWLLSKLISTGDVISTDTTRKIHTTTTDSTSKKNPSRVRIELEIKITAVDYTKDSPVLRIRGKNMTSTDHIKLGAFHTLELEKNKEFNLTKKVWDEESINLLKEGSDRSAGADLVVILMNERSAKFYSIGKNITTLCAPIEENSTNNKSGNKFFECVFQAFVKNIDFNVIRCVIIGSYGSIKDEIKSYLLSESQKLKIKSVGNNKSRIVLVNTTKNGMDIRNLKDVLNDPNVMSLIKETKAGIEVKEFRAFMDILDNTPDKACYGTKSVEIADELKAIETLMITDELFRNENVGIRQKYVELVKSVKEAGGKAMVFSLTHVCSEKLAQLTGIAAILRFPIPDLDDLVL